MAVWLLDLKRIIIEWHVTFTLFAAFSFVLFFIFCSRETLEKLYSTRFFFFFVVIVGFFIFIFWVTPADKLAYSFAYLLYYGKRTLLMGFFVVQSVFFFIPNLFKATLIFSSYYDLLTEKSLWEFSKVFFSDIFNLGRSSFFFLLTFVSEELFWPNYAVLGAMYETSETLFYVQNLFF